MVIFRDSQGRTLSLDDLRGVSGTFSYEVIGNSAVPAEAAELHRQARRAGAAGDYKNAIELLERAAKSAPNWPYPVYDRAFTHLLMDDVENARKYYRRTVELSPRGFFTAITAADTLDRESNGELPAGTYHAYLALEWLDDSVKKKEIVRQLVERIPNFAPVWKDFALQTDDDAKIAAALEKGPAARPDAETKAILLINQALLFERRGDHDRAIQILGNLGLDPNSTFAAEHLAKATLASIVKK